MTRKAYRFFLDYEKEEAWLNQMASQGWEFVHFSFFRYLFTKGKPGSHIYRIVFLKHSPRGVEGQGFLEFLEETEIEIVQIFFRWVYLRRAAGQGPFEVYSDRPALMAHYRRLMGMTLAVGAANLSVAASNFTLAVANNLKTHYLLVALNLTFACLAFIAAMRYWRRFQHLKKEGRIRE